MKEDSPTVMFGGKTTEIKEYLREHVRTVHEGRIANCDVWKEDFG